MRATKIDTQPIIIGYITCNVIQLNNHITCYVMGLSLSHHNRTSDTIRNEKAIVTFGFSEKDMSVAGDRRRKARCLFSTDMVTKHRAPVQTADSFLLRSLVFSQLYWIVQHLGLSCPSQITLVFESTGTNGLGWSDLWHGVYLQVTQKYRSIRNPNKHVDIHY